MWRAHKKHNTTAGYRPRIRLCLAYMWFQDRGVQAAALR